VRTAPTLALILAFAAAHLVAWTVLDRRPLNDHDRFFAGPASVAVAEWRDGHRVDALRRQLLGSPSRHPQLAQTTLVAVAGTFGWTRPVVRLANLPWLLLLVLGTFAAARELLGPRLALLAAWLAATLPIVVHMSRKWFIHFHTAALAVVGLWLVLAIVRRQERADVRWWLGLGAVAGLRVHTHPIDLPDVALGLGLATMLTARAAGPRLLLVRLGAALAPALLLGAPFLLGAGTVEGAGDASSYADRAALWLNPGGSGGLAWAVALPRAARLLHDTWWMAPAAWLVAIPGLLGLARLVPRADPAHRRLLVVPGLAVGLQAPLGLLSFRNFGYLADWLFLLPPLLLLALAGLEGWSDRLSARARGLWRGVVIAQGAAVVVVPLALSGGSVDWLLVDRDEAATWERPFLASEHGRAYDTHHLAVRQTLVGERVVDAMLASADPTELGLVDLAVGLCAPASTTHWWPPEGTTPSAGLADDLFGFAGVSRPRFQGADGEVAATTVVRLWKTNGPCDEGTTLARVDVARVRARERFGPDVTIEALLDPAEQLIGNATPGLSPDPLYLHAALLVR